MTLTIPVDIFAWRLFACFANSFKMLNLLKKNMIGVDFLKGRTCHQEILKTPKRLFV